jgi:predicted lipoprotein with Yx(FWY)xxD motif
VPRLLVVLAASAVVLVGCSGSETTSTQQPAQPSSAPGGTSTSRTPAPTTGSSATEATPGTIIKTAGSQFGEILFDGSKQAIYLFDKEKASKPECYDECARAWPPVLTKGAPMPAGAADADALGTTRRTDGSTQVTYGGHPLYYYAHDGKNEVRCHNVREFGGLWLVLTPTGEAAPH